MISVTSRWWRTIDSKEMPWIASVKPRTWPVSSVGMKPLGTTLKSQAVTPRITKDSSSVTSLWRMANRSVVS